MAELLDGVDVAGGGTGKKPVPPLSPKGQTLYKKDVEAARARAAEAEAEALRLRKHLEAREAGQREWAAKLARGETEAVTSAVMAKVLGQRREQDDGPVEELLRTWLDAKGFEVFVRMLEERRGAEQRAERERVELERGGAELPPSEVEKMLEGVMSEILSRGR